jgi:hypothetical protein
MTPDLQTVIALFNRIAPPVEWADGRKPTATRCAALAVLWRTLLDELEGLERLTMLPSRPVRTLAPALAPLSRTSRARIDAHAARTEVQARWTLREARHVLTPVPDLLAGCRTRNARRAAVVMGEGLGHLFDATLTLDVGGAILGHDASHLVEALLDRVEFEAGLICASLDRDHEAAARVLVKAFA